MNHWVYEWLAWCAVGAILTAYIGANVGLLDTTQWPYQMLNAVGALVLVVSSAHKKHFQPLVLNLVWFVVAFIALWAMLFG